MFCILWRVWLVVFWDLFDWLCSEICLIGRVLRPVWLVVFWDLFDWSCSEICLIGRVLRSVWLVVFWDLFDWLCSEICLIGCVLRSDWLVVFWDLLEPYMVNLLECWFFLVHACFDESNTWSNHLRVLFLTCDLCWWKHCLI